MSAAKGPQDRAESRPDATGPTPDAPGRRTRVLAIGLCLAAFALVVLVSYDAVATAPVRGAVRAYTQLITAANRGDLNQARQLCTPQFLEASPLKLAEEGGIIGLPRAIHKNFHAWRHGPDVWICPSNRSGPVFQLRRDGNRWLFDGLVAERRAGNVLILPKDDDGNPN